MEYIFKLHTNDDWSYRSGWKTQAKEEYTTKAERNSHIKYVSTRGVAGNGDWIKGSNN